jgi:hypothetical protein
LISWEWWAFLRVRAAEGELQGRRRNLRVFQRFLHDLVSGICRRDARDLRTRRKASEEQCKDILACQRVHSRGTHTFQVQKEAECHFGDLGVQWYELTGFQVFAPPTTKKMAKGIED